MRAIFNENVFSKVDVSMSAKWRSSKMVSVNGTSFKRARLAFKNQDESLQRGEYGYGSQEWLAAQARVSPRTVNELETGKATLKTVDAVSKILNIQGREYILGYGEEFTTFRATGVIDFRSTINGRLPECEEAYLDEAFLVTILPMVITVEDDFIDTALLKHMQMHLSVGDLNIKFSWIYNVHLNSRAQTWLGDEEDVREVDIHTGESYQESVMFKQDSFDIVSWGEFIAFIKETNEKRILLSTTLEFEHFKKKENVVISVEEVKALFERGYPQGYPYWIEPNALMV